MSLIHAMPKWARIGRPPRPLTEIEQERIRVDAHIPVGELARLMGRDWELVHSWARANGIGRVCRRRLQLARPAQKPGRKPRPMRQKRQSVYTQADAEVARLVSLAAVANLGARREANA